jgi:hypothetical protein
MSWNERAVFQGPIGAVVAIACVLCGPARADENDLRDLRVGMSVLDIAAEEYLDLRCVASPETKLDGWSQFRRCPATADGLRAVSFRFNESRNALAAVNDKYEGTKIAGHPVVLTMSIGEDGRLERLRIDTDPKARLFLRKKAHLLALVARTRFGEEGWRCKDVKLGGGETAVGGVLVNEHCEKSAEGRVFLLDRAVYRRPGQSSSEFVNETHLEIRRTAR